MFPIPVQSRFRLLRCRGLSKSTHGSGSQKDRHFTISFKLFHSFLSTFYFNFLFLYSHLKKSRVNRDKRLAQMLSVANYPDRTDDETCFKNPDLNTTLRCWVV